ncbi:MAG: hypothetical protein MK108_06470 [Mariniblastus sp.]|nr:hypothetical protein [Mariniblastus sp.]
MTTSKNIAESNELLDTFQDVDKPAAGVVKHCRSCWRQELHYPISIPPFALGFLMIFTLGLVLFVRPNQCTCCGRTRLF